MAEKKSVNTRISDTLTINGVTVRVVFAQEDNVQILKSVKETLKESYNRQLEETDSQSLSA